jgi:hypothetical protein
MEHEVWALGDCVIVKPGVRDPATGREIGGWQGRISAISADEAGGGPQLVSIEWDSFTLAAMPAELIEYCEDEGLVWSEMTLAADEVAPAVARDTAADVGTTLAKLEVRYRSMGWSSGEQGERVRQVVNRAPQQDADAVLQVWHTYLHEHSTLPFGAQVAQGQPDGSVREGEQVTVIRVTALDASSGTLVAIRHPQGVCDVPINDLDAMSGDAATCQLVADHGVWFANR